MKKKVKKNEKPLSCVQERGLKKINLKQKSNIHSLNIKTPPITEGLNL